MYHFRVVNNVQLTLSQDNEVTVVQTNGTKAIHPDPPPQAPLVWSDQAAQWDTHGAAFNGAGFGGAAQTPMLTVTRDDARG